MRWIFLLVGLLLLLVGLVPYLGGWGIPASVVDTFSRVPTFSLSRWIFTVIGALLFLYGFKR